MHVVAESISRGGYDPSLFEELAQVEDRHFWFRARNRLIFEIAKKLTARLHPGYLVLEVGCGTGNVLRVC
jgi:ubiquinone/menaquinone biosynthesis C-methylase UbiE